MARRPHCCHVGCEEDATHEILAVGPQVPKDDYIHACAKHVGLLLGCPDGTEPVVYWTVTELPKGEE